MPTTEPVSRRLPLRLGNAATLAVACATLWLTRPVSGQALKPSANTNSLLGSPVSSASALTNWNAAALVFQRAGAFVGQEEYPKAKATLLAAGTNLPAPYSELVTQLVPPLDSALQLSTNRDNPRRLQALLELCNALRAHAAALQLYRRLNPSLNADELGEDPLYAWRLVESGDLKAGLAEYQRRLAKEQVEIWQTYYQDQIRLLQQMPTGATNPQVAVDLAKERYLRGLEAPADPFAALRTLTAAVPFAKESKPAVALYLLITKCLSSLGDEQGYQAWEQKFLQDYKADPEVCARVLLARGTKAYHRQDLKESEASYQTISSDYRNTSAWGDAQFGLGVVLQAEQKYDEAISQYTRLLTSNLKEELNDPNSSEDYPNYRFRSVLRISECYEAKKDLPQALQYALLARDRYVFVSYCHTCMDDTRKEVAERVKKLQAALK